MTYSTLNSIAKQKVINSILSDDKKRKKWNKATEWLKSQMIEWEMQKL
ncbi:MULTISPECIES: hypothetical protein [Flammeovirga]|uniref:Uncharacterized protein n=1 Tax=Flammeovirga agarivorans TaxID=2726742 RepID=A0A7X8XZ26_9BACT|nr:MULTISPECIES: hypothetical protein [Flammeovirga]NLR94771.1 hypothetical protein [Flammeovirga agarivorans]